MCGPVVERIDNALAVAALGLILPHRVQFEHLLQGEAACVVSGKGGLDFARNALLVLFVYPSRGTQEKAGDRPGGGRGLGFKQNSKMAREGGRGGGGRGRKGWGVCCDCGAGALPGKSAQSRKRSECQWLARVQAAVDVQLQRKTTARVGVRVR